MDSKIIDLIVSRMDKMEEKIDRLLAFKWQVVGGTVVVSLILTTIFQVVIAVLERNH